MTTKQFWMTIVLFVILTLCVVAIASAHDHSRPDLDSWYSGLHGQGTGEPNNRGASCCDGPPPPVGSDRDPSRADAMHLAEDNWKRTPDGQHYMVEVPVNAIEFDKWRRGESFERKWVEVPDSALVTVPNLDGRPLVWPSCGALACSVRCFMPGAGG